ncbi:uncharacterized protein SCHCODRAFT_02621229 [Schizophyllum commune H4-8]|nr:uncharacterized protein SCHCODRAFT_02621229 [Schizophyllum commune H4-8]KAI5893242.1 hypothetical protein SCHCODRAFT_02621229 [Schizophyllum commune H4-8]
MSASTKTQQNGQTHDDIEFLSAPTRVARGMGKTGRAPVFATNQQMRALQAAYQESTFIQGSRLQKLADDVGLTQRWIALWFQRQRRKTRDEKPQEADQPVKQEDEVPSVKGNTNGRVRKRRKSKKMIEDEDDDEQDVGASSSKSLVKKEPEDSTATVPAKPLTLTIRLPALKRAHPTMNDAHSEVTMVVDPQPVTQTASSQPTASSSRPRSGSIIDFGDTNEPMPAPTEHQQPLSFPRQESFPSASRPPSPQEIITQPQYQSHYDPSSSAPQVFLPVPPTLQPPGSPVSIPSSSSDSDDSDLASAPPLLASNPHARALHAGAPVDPDVATQPAYKFTDPTRLREMYVDMYSRPGPAPLDVLAPPQKRTRTAYEHLAKYPTLAPGERAAMGQSQMKQEPGEGSLQPRPSPYMPPPPPPAEGEEDPAMALSSHAEEADPTAREPSEEVQLAYPDAASPSPPPSGTLRTSHGPAAALRTQRTFVKTEPASDAPALRPANFEVPPVPYGAPPWRPMSPQPSRRQSTVAIPNEELDEDSPAALFKQLAVLKVADDAGPVDVDASAGQEYVTDREEILRRLLDPALAERDPVQAAMGLVFLARVGMQDYL